MVRAMLSLMSAISVASCSSPPVKVDTGPVISRAYAAAGFDGVSLLASDDVEIKPGVGFLVTATGRKTALDYLEISAISNVLVIERKTPSDVSIAKGAKITITMPLIQRASIEGSGDMAISAAATGNFQGAVSGSGDLTMTQLRADAATFAASGSGKIMATGRATSAKLSVTGSGNIQIRGTQACTISTRGSGTAICTR